MEKYFCIACESIWINNRQCVETIQEEPKLKLLSCLILWKQAVK